MVSHSIPCAALLGLLIVQGCANPKAPNPTPNDTKQISQAFTLNRSAAAEYAKGKDGGDFYVSLQVQNLRPISADRCLDKSFVAWVRKFFYQDAKRIALVVKVKGPDDFDSDIRTIPLFETSQDEKTSSCLTSIQTDRDITNKYVAYHTTPFDITATIETDSDPAVTGAQTTLDTANAILGYVAGSANLTKILAGNVMTDAARKVDSSLQANFRQKSEQRVQFALSPWPRSASDDWSKHNDRAVFAAGQLSATATGISADNALEPNIAISLNYDVSLFGNGPGHYIDVDRILTQHVATANQDDLNTILKKGIGGFTSDQGKAIASMSEMSTFCSKMRGELAKYFTADDALAARYAVLKASTNYMISDTLQSAPGCFEDNDSARLTKLNAAFAIPDLERLNRNKRQDFVDGRTKLVAKALATRTREAIAATSDTPDAFIVDFSMVHDAMPARSDGKSWDVAKGNDAFDMLVSAGRLKLGCARAIANQNLTVIPTIVVIDQTHKSVAALLEFGSGEPEHTTNAKSVTANLRSITLLPLALAQKLYALPPWTEEICPLL